MASALPYFVMDEDGAACGARFDLKILKYADGFASALFIVSSTLKLYVSGAVLGWSGLLLEAAFVNT